MNNFCSDQVLNSGGEPDKIKGALFCPIDSSCYNFRTSEKVHYFKNADPWNFNFEGLSHKDQYCSFFFVLPENMSEELRPYGFEVKITKSVDIEY